MLRKDALYMLNEDCDSHIPTEEVISQQISLTSFSGWLPTRLRMGKFTLGQYNNQTSQPVHNELKLTKHL